MTIPHWVVPAAMALMLALSTSESAASPVFLEVETGSQLFKYNDRALDSGVPKFSDWTWDFSAHLEWSPAERTGIYLVAGFRYQALGRSEYSDQTFFDGPRFALKWRGRLIP